MEYHLFVTLPLYFLLHTGLGGIFKKSGESFWKAYVPVYNVWIWLKIIGKPSWWIFMLCVPVLNFVLGITLILDLLRSFGKNDFKDHALGVIVPYFYFLYLGFNNDKYLGKWSDLASSKKKDSTTREWLDAILFAGTAALIIRTFLIEAFMIPTTSMEGSLLAGDFLFVSKVHYGVRLPMAPISFPFVHNTLPFTTGSKSYLPLELPYSRLPGLKDIERNEIVVFNYPDDDRNPDVDELGPVEITSMKQNYIKRCVGVPGDVITIKHRQLFINDQPAWGSENLQYSYTVVGITQNELLDAGFRINTNPKKKISDNNDNAKPFYGNYSGNAWELHMNETRKSELVSKYPDLIIQPVEEDLSSKETVVLKQYWDQLTMTPPKYQLFPKLPYLRKLGWTQDNFGPLWIPKKGETIEMNEKNFWFYEKCISVYEKHKLEKKGDRFFIDGAEVKSYTFEMNYYWMMGDNRHASLDSRFWGFVPEDHIVGRPWFVLFSWEGGPRWSRFFNPVTSWEP